MSTTFLVVALLAVALLVLDRLAAHLAGRVVARVVARAEQLPHLPSVRITGVPFLLQAVRGCYRHVDVSLTGLRRDEVRVQQVDIALEGVQLRLGDLLGGGLQKLPCRRVHGRLELLYGDLDRTVGDRLSVSEGTPVRGQGRLRVRGRVRVLGQSVSAATDSVLLPEGSALLVRAERFYVGVGLADAVLSRALGGRFDFRVDVGPMPVPLETVEVTPRGLVLVGSATDVELETG